MASCHRCTGVEQISAEGQTAVIQEERLAPLNSQPIGKGAYVLYWMQASQRAECNHALQYAVSLADDLAQPLVAYFGVTDDFPQASERHYRFMLEGLRETQTALRDRGIQMVVRHESPEKGALAFSRDARVLVVDAGYLRVQREWRRHVAERAECPVLQVEGDAVVPVQAASSKEEYSAATLRSKIQTRLSQFLLPLEEREPKSGSLRLDFDSFDIDDTDRALSELAIDREVKPVTRFRGGAGEASRYLDDFVAHKLDRYAEARNDPNGDPLSNMSPYLHFGQISPLRVALRILESGSPGRDAYLEELVVRRELSMNYVFYNDHYDLFLGLPNWARKTLQEHRHDWREDLYSLDELEAALTHDPYWNAAQKEMLLTGKMHGYMRMYWGKKILEWSPTPEDAFRAALYLNNRYELDGRDPNGFAGVAWCFGKHDRPWGERPVFGKVRYMNSRGLSRKFDADAYARGWQSAVAVSGART
jgi:deoxyribodipyrimidine photo-lyase